MFCKFLGGINSCREEEEMKKIILLVEDLPEELEKAKAVISGAGFKAAVASNLSDALRLWKTLGEKISGVITDLHFPERSDAAFVEKTAKNPNGLVIITEALVKNVPASVCSDVDHHFAAYLKQVVGNLEKITGRKIPFTMDRKNWQLALNELTKIMP
jgi:CheY-like chemotaxis protein